MLNKPLATTLSFLDDSITDDRLCARFAQGGINILTLAEWFSENKGYDMRFPKAYAPVKEMKKANAELDRVLFGL